MRPTTCGSCTGTAIARVVPTGCALDRIDRKLVGFVTCPDCGATYIVVEPAPTLPLFDGADV